jgi:hypothetical protein
MMTALAYAVKGLKTEVAIYLVSVGADPYEKKKVNIDAINICKT